MGELLANPAAVEVIRRRFPKAASGQLMAAARTLTLEQVMELAKVYLPPAVLNETLRELQRI